MLNIIGTVTIEFTSNGFCPIDLKWYETAIKSKGVSWWLG